MKKTWTFTEQFLINIHTLDLDLITLRVIEDKPYHEIRIYVGEHTNGQKYATVEDAKKEVERLAVELFRKGLADLGQIC